MKTFAKTPDMKAFVRSIVADSDQSKLIPLYEQNTQNTEQIAMKINFTVSSGNQKTPIMPTTRAIDTYMMGPLEIQAEPVR